MSETGTSQPEIEVAHVLIETGKQEELPSEPQSQPRVGGAARELKAILALSKETKFDINLPKKRKFDQGRHSKKETPAKSNMPKKEHRLTRFPVTAEAELELDLPHTTGTIEISEESCGKLPKKKKSFVQTDSPNVSGNLEEKRKERKSFSISGEFPIFKPNKDMFCWRCHREGVNIACETCPRSYHSRCLKQTIDDPEHWPCPECVTILKAESTQSRSPAMKGMTLEHLCSLLKFAVIRMKQIAGSAPFTQPVDPKDFPEYEKYIIQPMDLSCLEQNIKENLYGSTHAFEADAKWILHNSIVFNSYQSKLTSVAKTIMKICKQEMAEIENCPTCYLNANTKKNTWFVEVCPKPHLLVWAKLKGFPFWPGKVMSCRDGNVDVRFFGAHDRAWVPEKECFLYMPRDPNGFRSKRNDIEKCIEELEVHVEHLKQVFGQFCYPDCKIPIDPQDELKQLQIFLPQYKSYVNRTKRYKLFHNIGKIENKTEKSEKTHKVEEVLQIEDKKIEELKVPEEEKMPQKEPVESSSKDDSEAMEGYGTDDESMSVIDVKTRAKLLTKGIHTGQNGSGESSKSLGKVITKGELKGFSKDQSIIESDLVKKDYLEKNVDVKMFSSRDSDIVSDSSRLSDKISTVDVLEDMEINLGNDKGTSCVNISRKNSFDSSDYSTDSNTSSRKAPVKMDVDNFEVILTSPTKLKIVDKLMKRLSDGNSEEGGSPKPKVVRKVSETETEREFDKGRDELSPEPKQLEEPPMDYSENEAEAVEIFKETNEKENEEEKSKENNCLKLTKEVIEEHADKGVDESQKCISEESIESSSQSEAEILAKSTESESENAIYVISRNLSKSRDKSIDRLTIKIKRSKVDDSETSTELNEEKQTNENEHESRSSEHKSNNQKIQDNIEETQKCLETCAELKNGADISKSCHRIPKPSSSKSSNSELPSSDEDPDSSKGQWKIVDRKLCFSNEKRKDTIQMEVLDSLDQENVLSAPKTCNKYKDEHRIDDIKTPEINDLKETFVNDVCKSSSDLEKWTRKVIGIATPEKKKKVDANKLRQSAEFEEMEDEDDDMPLSHIQAIEKIDKENILKVIHSDLVTTSIGESKKIAPISIENKSLELTENSNTEDSNSSVITESAPCKNKGSDIKLTLSKKGLKINENAEKTKSKNASDLNELLEDMSSVNNGKNMTEGESNLPEMPSVSEKHSIISSHSINDLRTSRNLSSEFSEGENSSKLIQLLEEEISHSEEEMAVSVSQTRKRKLSTEMDDKQKKTRTDTEEISNKEKLISTEEIMDLDKDEQVPNKDKEVKGNEDSVDESTDKEDSSKEESVHKIVEKENSNMLKVSLCKLGSVENLDENLGKTSKSDKSKVVEDKSSSTKPQLFDVVTEIKSELDSEEDDATSEPVIENLEAKKKYLSALNILERDSEAFHKKKDDSGEIRTRSKTEQKKEKIRVADNLSKIIDDVAVNYSAKKSLIACTPMSKPRRKSLDDQHTKDDVIVCASQPNRSENGEIFVKSFAKIVTKPRARKSFPQTLATSTETRQIQQIKMARREDSNPPPLLTRAAPTLRRNFGETKTIPQSVSVRSAKEPQDEAPGTHLLPPPQSSPMTVLQQLENMTTGPNKSFIIVTPQNQDVVMLPPNKPINYQTPPSQTVVVSMAPVIMSSGALHPTNATTSSSTTSKSKLTEKPAACVNLTDSQNYIPFNKDPIPPKPYKPLAKQMSVLVSNTMIATSTTTAASDSCSTAASVNTGAAVSSGQAEATEIDEEMPLQSGSVSSNLDNLSGIIGNGGGSLMPQEEFNGPTQTEEDTTIGIATSNAENSEDDEFRLINNLIPGSVAKVVHEIVHRQPPKLKPRPPGMLSTIFNEGIPSSAGPVTTRINSVAHRLSDYLRGMLIETVNDFGKSDNNELTIGALKLEIEALKHKHSIELSEIEKNMCTVLKDIQRSIIEDRERIIEETRAACEAETIKRVEEAKSKQWCANCQKEAQFYCCWNTSYCDYPCQQKHWPQHMTKCTQSQNGGTSGNTALAQGGSSAIGSGAGPTVVRPLSGQQLILRPTGAKPGSIGRVFAKPVQKVYLNRNTTAPKTLRVQSSNGGYLTVMEAPPGQYQVVSTLPSSTVVRTAPNPCPKKNTPTTSSAALAGTTKPKVVTPAKILSHSAPGLFEDQSG